MDPSRLFEEMVARSRADRAQVRRLVGRGEWLLADPDRTRTAAFLQRRVEAIARPGAESIVGSTIDFLGAAFLPAGSLVRRSVGYVEVNDQRASEVGSGFLISPRLFLTNQHVICDANAARSAQVIFDREMDERGSPRATTSFLLDPDTFCLFSAEDDLDYALIAIGRRLSGSAAIEELGSCPISDSPDRHVIGMNVNIVQHPRGWPKMIAVRNNLLTYRTDRTLLYETDTDVGSSGSPVFNDSWEVVALHHYGRPFLERKDEQDQDLPATINEGVRISAVYRNLQTRAGSLRPDQRLLLEEALTIASRASESSAVARTLSGPRLRPAAPTTPAPEPARARTEDPTRIAPTLSPSSESAHLMERTPVPIQSTSHSISAGEIRVTTTVDVIIRGDAGAGPVSAASPAAPTSLVSPIAATPSPTLASVSPTLRRSAEALRLDKDYTNRKGYNPKFIPGVDLPLPKLGATLLKQLAPLRSEEPDAAEGELKYTHFSIRLNKGRRMAIYTATNIDGATYQPVNRRTGEVSDAEGETWFIDPRVSASFFLDQTFYSTWSVYFDRGHLTRRNDPTWGTAEDCERANADTFHFTNCTPQHFRFNQTAQYWQGAERYVLENGMLAADERKPISVFQGPIFNDAIDLWADDVQIPSSFFKVVVWKGATRLRAVGLVVDQLHLLSEQRINLGPPRDIPSVDVSEWRLPITLIEQRTDLKFGDAIVAADTFGSGGQPQVGGESLVRIKSLDDFLRGVH